MNNLSQKIMAMPETEVPVSLHNKILRKAFFLKLEKPIIFVLSLLSLNLIVSGWHIWTKIVEADFITVIKLLFGNFELSYRFFLDFAQIIAAVISLRLILIFALNFILVAYVAHSILSLKRSG